MTLKELIQKHLEWELYKVLYLGILVPLLFEEVKNWLFKDFLVAIVFFATAIILLLPSFFKVLNIVKFIIGYFEGDIKK